MLNLLGVAACGARDHRLCPLHQTQSEKGLNNHRMAPRIGPGRLSFWDFVLV